MSALASKPASFCLSLAAALTITAGPLYASDLPDSLHWQILQEGLDYCEIDIGEDTVADSLIVLLRIDPANWQFSLLMQSEQQDSVKRSARGWSEQAALPVVFNAGMYLQDRIRHVGYARNGGHINQSRVPRDYLSSALFDPIDPADPPFQIADLDIDSLADLNARYRVVIQNLRLLKDSAENRWPPSTKRWSELALAQDSQGRALVIFCSYPITMYDFNELLRTLPVEIRKAQHLEGGIEAQLAIDLPNFKREFIGLSHGGGKWLPSSLAGPLPNVIGLSRRP